MNAEIKNLENRLMVKERDLYNLMHTIREQEYAEHDQDDGRITFWKDRLNKIMNVQPYGTIVGKT